MEQKINLKQLEKNTASGIFQTGIIDIGMGMIFVISTLTMIFDDIRYYLDILYIIPVLFIMLTIRYVVQPRMGIVYFTRRRKRKNGFLIATITIFLVIFVAFTFFGNTSTIAEYINPRWIVTGIIFFICIAVAFFLNFYRMYLYAFLLAGAFNWSEEIRENPGIITEGGYAYLFASLILLIIGFVYLLKFLKNYPLAEKGVSYEK